jgi:hypothetical protein
MFALKKTGRAPRNRRRLMLWTGILALIAIYWALPAVIAELLRFRFALVGFTQIEVASGRPSWDELHLDSLQLSKRYGSRNLTLHATELTVRYRPLDLLSGHLISIRIQRAEIESSFASEDIPDRDEAEAPESIGPLAFVPGRWLSKLPADELSLESLDLDIRTPAGARHMGHATALVQNGRGSLSGEIRTEHEQAFAFSAHAAASGELELAVRASGSPKPPVLHIAVRTAQTENDHLSVDGSAQADLEGIADLLRPWLGPGRDLPQLSGNLESRWQGAVPLADRTWEGVKISSDHHLEVSAEPSGGEIRRIRANLEASVSVEGNRIHWHIGNRSDLSVFLKNSLEPPSEPAARMTFPNGLAGLVEVSPEGPVLRVAPGFPIHLAPADWNGISSSEIELEFADSATLFYQPELARWKFEPFVFSVKPVSINGPNGAVETETSAIRINELGGVGAGWKSEGELHVRGIKPQLLGRPLPSGEIKAKFRGDSKQLDIESVMTLAQGGILLNGRARHQFTLGRGSAWLELTPVVFGESGSTLSRLLQPWPYPFDVHAGRIHAFGGASWSRASERGTTGKTLRLESRITLDAEGLAGHLKTVHFEQLDAHLGFTEQGNTRTLDPARLSLERLNLGVPITQLNANLAVNQSGGKAPILEVRHFEASLLGGTVHSDAFQWDTSAPSAPVKLSIRDLSLAQIIALEKQQGIEGTGVLDGQLPLEFTRTHVALHGGELQARAPGGWIRYRPTEGVAAMAKDNLSLQFVNQALSNLQFKTLKVEANSNPKGDLTLRVELRGHNPEWQAGRPIHLNLNLQENIPTLLRSLSIADDLTDRMNQQIQEHYQKKQ